MNETSVGELPYAVNKYAKTMNIIQNDQDYYQYIATITVFLMMGFATVQILTSFSFIGCFLFLAVELFFLSQKFTETVRINASTIEIDYYRFLTKKKLVVNTPDVSFQKKKINSLKNSGYVVINILEKEKQVYKIDSRDGFEEKDLNTMLASLEEWCEEAKKI